MSSIQRARILRDHNRFEEAIAELHLVLAADPDHAEAHAELAQTQMSLPDREKQAMESIEAALAIEADNPDYLAIKSLILSEMDRPKEGLTVADQALSFEPGPYQWFTRSVALAGLKKWSEAEQACRNALEIDPDYDGASNLLNHLLRVQGKLDHADNRTFEQLSRNAENPEALANAGWTKLQRNQHKEAEELFREALRIDATNEFARDGLVEAYKARSLFYRLYLKWVFFLQRMEGKSQWILIIGLYLGFKVGRNVLSKIHPALGAAVLVIYLLLVFGSFIAPGIGHFLLLKDRFARLCLTKREKWDGLAVGGLFFLGLILAIVGFSIGILAIAVMGVSIIIASVPASLIFRNHSQTGQFVFGGLALFALLAGAITSINTANGYAILEGPHSGLAGLAILAVALSTWLTGIGGLVKMR